jgi:hypothetical protein
MAAPIVEEPIVEPEPEVAAAPMSAPLIIEEPVPEPEPIIEEEPDEPWELNEGYARFYFMTEDGELKGDGDFLFIS